MLPKIDLIIGPMFAGKTKTLIDRIERFRAIGLKCLLVNTTKDTRCDDNKIQTHIQSNGNHIHVDAIKINKISDIPNPDLYDVIGIDEANFFDDILDIIHMKNIFVVAGLKGSFKQTPFGKILDLIPCANSITILEALCVVCKNGTSAPFTKCKNNEGGIGASDKYEAVCANHL